MFCNGFCGWTQKFYDNFVVNNLKYMNQGGANLEIF